MPSLTQPTLHSALLRWNLIETPKNEFSLHVKASSLTVQLPEHFIAQKKGKKMKPRLMFVEINIENLRGQNVKNPCATGAANTANAA